MSVAETALRVLSVLLALGVVGCNGIGSGAEDLQDGDYLKRLVLSREVRLEQNDAAFLASLGALEVGLQGDILLPDPSEGDVKWFDSTGNLKRTIGRKGRGPGEFVRPHVARFLSGGGVIVLDIAEGGVLSVFGRDGDLVNRIVLSDLTALNSLEVLADGDLLVTGRAVSVSDRHVLFRLSPNGEIRNRYLSIANIRPEGTEEHPLWNMFRTFSLGVSDHTAYVTAAVSDSIWKVDLRTGIEGRTRIPIPNGKTRLPHPPRQGFATPGDLIRWASQFQLAAAPVVSSDLLFVRFGRGGVTEGDLVTAIRTDDAWSYHVGPPVILRSAGDLLVGLLGEVDQLSIAFYQVRR